MDRCQVCGRVGCVEPTTSPLPSPFPHAAGWQPWRRSLTLFSRSSLPSACRLQLHRSSAAAAAPTLPAAAAPSAGTSPATAASLTVPCSSLATGSKHSPSQVLQVIYFSRNLIQLPITAHHKQGYVGGKIQRFLVPLKQTRNKCFAKTASQQINRKKEEEKSRT